MNASLPRFLLAALLTAASLPATSGSIATSSAAGGSSASSAASSAADTAGDSSASSARAVAAADGPYRVVDTAPVPGRPDAVRVTLQALSDSAPDATLRLVLPKPAVERGGLAAGRTIVAQQRTYGVAFATEGRREPFFLVLRDDVQRELRSNPVTL
jgi:hypothetical protein